MTDDRRQHLRVEWFSRGTIMAEHGRPERSCIVNNLSNGGVKLSEVLAKSLPDEFWLRLDPSKGQPRKCRVIWREKYEVGVKFEEPFPSLEKPRKAKRKAEVIGIV